MTKGYTLPHEPLRLRTEMLSVRCRHCNSIWQEEIEHYGMLAGWARTYDRCSNCYTPEEPVCPTCKEPHRSYHPVPCRDAWHLPAETAREK